MRHILVILFLCAFTLSPHIAQAQLAHEFAEPIGSSLQSPTVMDNLNQAEAERQQQALRQAQIEKLKLEIELMRQQEQQARQAPQPGNSEHQEDEDAAKDGLPIEK